MPDTSREAIAEQYRRMIESRDPMDTIQLTFAGDPDIAAAAMLYRVVCELEGANERHDEDPQNRVHLGLGRESRGKEAVMLRGAYEAMLDRCVTETYHILNECRCSECQGRKAHLN